MGSTTTSGSSDGEGEHEGEGILDARDPEFISRALPLLTTYTSYFRGEVRGLDRLPPSGPFLVVGNHSGGYMTPDIPVLMSHWWRERGVDEPVYCLFHSAFIGMPGVGDVMRRCGGLEAGHGNAEMALSSGGIVIVFPGGDLDAFRRWGDRNRIDFHGRDGFIRLALREGVPVVPVVSVGAHESLMVLSSGERLARLLPTNRLLRAKVFPIVAGPPWGVSVGGLPTLPLPAKITTEVLDPLDWSGTDPTDDAGVRNRYDEISKVMQAALDDLAAERRFPILG